MIRIREATEANAAAIARVHVDSWRTTYKGIVPGDYLTALSYEQREGVWRANISAARGREFVYVAQDGGGQVVGFASGGPQNSGDTEYAGELYAIYLLASHQGQGIGRQLVLAVTRRLLQADLPSMLVWVLASNSSRLFYEALGGKELYEKPITIGGASLVEVAYGWPDLSILVGE